MPSADCPRPIRDLAVFGFNSRRWLQCYSFFPLMPFEHIHGREVRAHLVEITVEALVHVLFSHIPQSVRNRCSFAVFSNLQICVLEEIHGMDLMLRAKMNGSRSLRCCDSGKVRLNIFLP